MPETEHPDDERPRSEAGPSGPAEPEAPQGEPETQGAPEAQGAPNAEPAPEQGPPGWGWHPPHWGPPPAGGWDPAGTPPVWAWPGPPAAPPRRKGRAVVALAMAALVLVASGIGIGWGLTSGRAHDASRQPVPVPSGAVPVRPGEEPGDGSQPAPAVSGIDVQAVIGEVDPAVVNIDTVIGTGIPGASSSFGEGRAAGTGMILTSSGLVLTNNHVIRGATSIEVTIQGRSGAATANVVGVAPDSDVALLQIQGVSGLPTITSADTSNLRAGQPVVAIGNAYGEGGEPAAAAGTITALEQSITARDAGSEPERLSGLIEANTPIAPGESGGALADAHGDVVGMITAASRFAPYRQPSNDAYAISIEDALGIVGGTAAGAGMKAGSATTRIDTTDIDSVETLGTVLHATKPGQSVSVTWEDRSGTHTATIRLITAPAV